MHPDNPALQAQFDRVLANLDDDGERLVYADMLTEASDPRGEFIVLQLLSEPSAEQRRRVTDLIRRTAQASRVPSTVQEVVAS